MRDRVERNDVAHLTIDDIDGSTTRGDSRRRRSRGSSDAGERGRLGVSRTAAPTAFWRRSERVAAQLVIHRLPIRYDRFGTRAGVS